MERLNLTADLRKLGQCLLNLLRREPGRPNSGAIALLDRELYDSTRVAKYEAHWRPPMPVPDSEPVEPKEPAKPSRHIDEAMAKIDQALSEPVIPIEQSLGQAVKDGLLSPAEAQEYFNAYLESFLND